MLCCSPRSSSCPSSAGVIVLLVPERSTRWIAAVITLVVFLLSLWLYFGLLGNGSGFGTVINPQWYDRAPLDQHQPRRLPLPGATTPWGPTA